MSTKDANDHATLFTPAESNNLNAFLSQLDKLDSFTPEWPIYSSVNADGSVKTADGREDLTRATRNLIAIDSNNGYPPEHHHHRRDSIQSLSPPNPNHLTQQHSSIIQNGYPQRDRYPSLRHDAHSGPPSSSSPTYPNPGPTKSSIHTPADLQPLSHRKRASLETHAPKPAKRLRKSPPTYSHDHPQHQYYAESSSSVTPVATLPPAEVSPTPPPPAHRSNSNGSGSGNGKPSLLSTSQKKANHIQSEQKRRAHIRRGYEALCEIVPALREAIRAEEEAERQNSEDLGGDGKSANTGSGRKRGKGKAAAAALGADEGEKIDGRAGPRSEAVVLQKTIEHIGDLEIRRTSLLDRLHHARRLLPPGHPALTPSPVPPQIIQHRRAPFLSPESRAEGVPDHDAHIYDTPAWQRIWDGGTGLPIPGMGLPKGPIRGSGRGASQHGTSALVDDDGDLDESEEE